MRVVSPFDGRLVAAKAIREEAGDTSDRRDADARQIVNAAIGQPLFEVFDDLPAINEGLEFGRRAQILEKKMQRRRPVWERRVRS